MWSNVVGSAGMCRNVQVCAGMCRNVHKEKLQYLYFSPDNLRPKYLKKVVTGIENKMTQNDTVIYFLLQIIQGQCGSL
jgi:predicted ATP-grasp superfamily ATP-dependent carboligase